MRGIHLEDSFEVVGIGFCRVIGRVDYVDVAWYEMFCAVWRGARRRGIAYCRWITGRMVEVGDGARVGEEERVAAQAGGDRGSNRG